MGYEAERKVKTSERTFEIIEYMSSSDSAGVSEIAADLEMNKGIVHNHLSTLRELGYVIKVDAEYSLSPRLYSLGMRVREKSPFYRFGTSVIKSVAQEVRAEVVLVQRSTHCGVVVGVAGSDFSDRIGITCGSTVNSDDSLFGLTLLAYSNESDPIETVRNCDWNVSPSDSLADRMNITNECILGPVHPDRQIRGVSLPIFDDNETLWGVLGIAIPISSAETRTQEIVEQARTARNQIESRFDYDWIDDQSFMTVKHAWINE